MKNNCFEKRRVFMKDKLYHASYNVFKNSILLEGLRTGMKPNWQDMENSGLIYLANSPEVAESFAECADVEDEIMKSGICIFAIDVSKLDETLLEHDPNILFEEEVYSFVYSKNIPPSALKLIGNE